jgi:hypothetical protein
MSSTAAPRMIVVPKPERNAVSTTPIRRPSAALTAAWTATASPPATTNAAANASLDSYAPSSQP